MKNFKAKSVEEILKELNSISDNETVEVNLKELLVIYKAIEDWRTFIHNSQHYPTIEVMLKYIGNRDKGMYSTMNQIYIKIFSSLLPNDIYDRLEE